jgi:hypothetical protein
MENSNMKNIVIRLWNIIQQKSNMIKLKNM